MSNNKNNNHLNKLSNNMEVINTPQELCKIKGGCIYMPIPDIERLKNILKKPIPPIVPDLPYKNEDIFKIH